MHLLTPLDWKHDQLETPGSGNRLRDLFDLHSGLYTTFQREPTNSIESSFRHDPINSKTSVAIEEQLEKRPAANRRFSKNLLAYQSEPGFAHGAITITITRFARVLSGSIDNIAHRLTERCAGGRAVDPCVDYSTSLARLFRGPRKVAWFCNVDALNPYDLARTIPVRPIRQRSAWSAATPPLGTGSVASRASCRVCSSSVRSCSSLIRSDPSRTSLRLSRDNRDDRLDLLRSVEPVPIVKFAKFRNKVPGSAQLGSG
ncbi:hypothetical protein K0M31_019734, partial [Melipona bicolor]